MPPHACLHANLMKAFFSIEVPFAQMILAYVRWTRKEKQNKNQDMPPHLDLFIAFKIKLYVLNSLTFRWCLSVLPRLASRNIPASVSQVLALQIGIITKAYDLCFYLFNMVLNFRESKLIVGEYFTSWMYPKESSCLGSGSALPACKGFASVSHLEPRHSGHHPVITWL